MNDLSGNNTQQSNNVLYDIFNKSNIVFLIWFLAIYLIIYLIMGILYQSDESSTGKKSVSRIFDLMIFVFFVFTLGYYFFNISDKEKQKEINNFASSVKNYIDDPLSIYSLVLFIFMFYTFIYITGIPMGYDTKPFTINFIESGAWILLVIILIADFFKYVLRIDIVKLFSQAFSNLWNGLPQNPQTVKSTDLSGNKVDVSGNKTVDNVPAATAKPEVFNISNNLYTYDDAKSICTSYGARLATYDDIEKSYNDGGEWCNYGWSEGQMIFFPTQKSTWDKLQSNPKHKNDCGRPGVNGGYIDNPYVRFGVNCFGIKPAATDADIANMKAKANQIYPQSPEDAMLDKKVQFWKEHADQLLHVNSFNNTKWSEF
jgi:hypothetical protein